MANWHVTTTGSGGNPGTLVSPWDIATGLSSLLVQPGDTVYLHGGTYYYPVRTVGTFGFTVSLQGTSESPITIRPYESDHVIIDGGITCNLTTFPMHVVIRELEVLVSENLSQTRTTENSGSDAPVDLVRPWGGMNFNKGTNVKLVNNIVHDNMQGIGFWGEVDGDSELYGNIIYHNGWIAPDRNHGHGVYTQNNNPDWKYIKNNILIDNFSLNMQAYGSEAAHIDRYHVERNLWCRLDLSDDGRILIGGQNASQTGRILNNIGSGKAGVNGAGLGIGYGQPGDDYIITGNIVWEGLGMLAGFTNTTKIDNLWWQFGWAKPRIEAFDGDRTGVEVDIPTSPYVYLDVNEYDSMRANLGIMNWTGESQIGIDFSSFLSVGQTYRIMDPMDMFGEPLATGIFEGEDIDVDLSGNRLDIFVVFAEEADADVTVDGGAVLRGTSTLNGVYLGSRSGGAKGAGTASNSVVVTRRGKGGGKKPLRMSVDHTAIVEQESLEPIEPDPSNKCVGIDDEGFDKVNMICSETGACKTWVRVGEAYVAAVTACNSNVR